MVFVGGQISEWICFIFLFSISFLLYGNTLHAKFTFDDNFAVIYNGDVSDKQRWFGEVFKHDFWGQIITSRMSHKSYRPFTTLVYRMIYFFHSWFYQTEGNSGDNNQMDMTPWISTSSPLKQMLQVDFHGHKEDYRGLDPFPYHFANVALHGIVSYLVYRLAYRLLICQLGQTSLESVHTNKSSILVFMKKLRYLGVQDERQSEEQQSQEASSPETTEQDFSSEITRAVEWQVRCQYQKYRRTPYQLTALLAGCLFVSHPIHTEAVAGIVGMAEILCALLGIPAVLCYIAAAEGRYYFHLMPQLKWVGEYGAYLVYLFTSVVLMIAASLTKEIGITMAGAMMIYDVFLCRGSKHYHIPRMLTVAFAAIMYVYLRNLVAGDHIVRIYRKVENPIPFSDDLSVRTMTTGFLHARYFGQLVAPIWLSADWSYKCIDYVSHMEDPRNILTSGLYVFLFLIVMAAWPWLIAVEFLLTQTGENGTKDSEKDSVVTSKQESSRVVIELKQSAQDKEKVSWIRGSGCNLVLIVGLMVGPFFPASNVLFYVGTFIGERLLYFPSVGYCIFIAEALWSILGRNIQTSQYPSNTLWHQFGLQSTVGVEQNVVVESHIVVTNSETQQQDNQEGNNRNYFRKFLFVLLSTSLLVAYSLKTVTRNRDWQDEGDLFMAAGKVCGESAKVSLNLGILYRRTQDWKNSLHYFQKAKQLEPTYCEPDYWIGLTMMSTGSQMNEGLRQLEKAISCKYVAAETVQTLNNVYKNMQMTHPNDPHAYLSWSRVLMLPYLNRIMEACHLLEQAYLIYQRSDKQTEGEQKLQACLEKLKDIEEHGDNYWVNVDGVFPPMSLSKETAKNERQCILARKNVHDTLQQARIPKSHKAKKALYSYLHKHADQCRTVPEDAKDPLTSQHLQLQGASQQMHNKLLGGYSGNVPQVHTVLVNMFQSADPEDPWLQLEWGKILIGEGREVEAARHLEVAGLILIDEVDREIMGEETTKLDVSGTKNIQVISGARGAVEALELGIRIGVTYPGTQDPCRFSHALCYIKHALSNYVHGLEGNQLAQEAQECTQQFKSKSECKQYVPLLVEALEQGKTLTSVLRKLSAPTQQQQQQSGRQSQRVSSGRS